MDDDKKTYEECDHEAVIVKNDGSFQKCADCGEVLRNQ